MRLKGLWSAIAQAAAKADSILATHAASAFGESNQSDTAERGDPSPKNNSSSSSSTKQSQNMTNSRGGAAAAAPGKKDKGRPPCCDHLVPKE